MPGPRRGAGGAHFSRALIARCAVLGSPLLRVCRMPPVPIQADHGRAPADRADRSRGGPGDQVIRPIPRPGEGPGDAVRLCAVCCVLSVVCGLWSAGCRLPSAGLVSRLRRLEQRGRGCRGAAAAPGDGPVGRGAGGGFCGRWLEPLRSANAGGSVPPSRKRLIWRN
ncbi:hypothetical protein SMALA_6968 [Streptomyces malaysiensis subsp. malaysiensis]|nr:hypothetical protein SMALA_6968 [Streptomyces malaysiensis]